MNRETWLRLTLLAFGFALGTDVLGWLAIPILGLAWGIVGRGTARPALTAGLAAALAWTGVLLGSWVVGPIPLLAGKLGALTGLGGITWIAATILFPLSLAWSAATITHWITARREA